MGGKSPEHEISLISGREVTKNLDHRKYNIVPILVSKNGERWQLTTEKSLNEIENPIKYKGTKREIEVSDKKVFTNMKNIPGKPDLVFIAMHGPYGEDGTVQGMLDLAGLKYTGSGILASAIGMNKLMFKRIMLEENIKIPKYVEMYPGQSSSIVGKKLGGPPYFIKPSDQGSSIGCSVSRNKKSLKKSLESAWRYSKFALVEEYVKGKELTCAVLGNEKPEALPVIEIVPKKAEYFDYNSKYLESGSEEIVPARISNDLAKRVQQIALRVHKVLGCRGFSRVDFIVKNAKTPLVLEINTIPGLTPMSLLPKAAKASGITYPRLLDKIIEYALE